MSLVTPEEVRVLVATSLTDDQLEAVIAREEASLISIYGTHYIDESHPIIESYSGGLKSVYLPRRISQIIQIVEDGEILDPDSFQLWGSQGRVERLPTGILWGDVVTLSFIPHNDNEIRKSVLIDLVRASVSKSSFQSESIGGEYSYNAGDQEKERTKSLHRLAITWL